MQGRALAGMGLLLALVPAGLAGPVLLREKLEADDCFRFQIRMDLKGQMTFQKEGQPQSLPLQATGHHVFPERVLQASKAGLPEKVARLYETASATIKNGNHSSQRSLRPDRKLYVAQTQNEQTLGYSPSGPLLSEELDLCSEHFDTLHLVGLLPGKECSIGQTWKVSNAVVQALCHFEGLTEQKIEGKLEEVKEGKAVFSVKGTASGVDLGSLVKIQVDARGTFDLSKSHLVSLEWKQKDEREQGPASPASTVEASTILERTPVKVPDGLSVVALGSVPEGLKVPAQMLQMEYQHPKKEYSLVYTRDWHIVTRTDEHLVLRLMDRGDFIGQATVAVWDRMPAGKHVNPLDFNESMNRKPGWNPTRTLEAREIPAENGRWIYRLTQLGNLRGLEVVQAFYIVAAADGRQVVLTFCMTPKQAEKLGPRDLNLLAGLDFPKQD